MKVYVYFNLHKKCWSIRHRGKVIAHADRVELANSEFRVSEAGRQRVLREKKKNVHAFVVGELVGYGDAREQDWSEMKKVSYNPYKTDHFFFCSTEQKIENADKVIMQSRGVYVPCES